LKKEYWSKNINFGKHLSLNFWSKMEVFVKKIKIWSKIKKVEKTVAQIVVKNLNIRQKTEILSKKLWQKSTRTFWSKIEILSKKIKIRQNLVNDRNIGKTNKNDGLKIEIWIKTKI